MSCGGRSPGSRWDSCAEQAMTSDIPSGSHKPPYQYSTSDRKTLRLRRQHRTPSVIVQAEGSQAIVAFTPSPRAHRSGPGTVLHAPDSRARRRLPTTSTVQIESVCVHPNPAARSGSFPSRHAPGVLQTAALFAPIRPLRNPEEMQGCSSLGKLMPCLYLCIISA